MKKTSLWSLALKRLLPIILSLSLLFANFDSLQVIAGEPDDEHTVEEHTQEPEEDEQEDNSDDEENGDDQNDDQNDESNPNNNNDSSVPPVQNGDNTPVEGNPANGEPTDGEPVDGENGNPIDDPNLVSDIQGQQRAMFGAPLATSNGDATDPENSAEPEIQRSITINFSIANEYENSGFAITGCNRGSFNFDEKKCVISDGEIDVEGEGDEKKYSAEVTFNYSINNFYELTDVSGGTKEGNTIKCTFEDIDFDSIENGNYTCTISGNVVKTDNDAPVISDVTVADGVATYNCTETGNTAFSTDASKLKITANITDDKTETVEENGEAVEKKINGSGVETVIIFDDKGNSVPMTKNGDAYTWSVPSYYGNQGNYKMTKIVAKDNVGNERTYDIPEKTLCFYQDNEETRLNVSITSEDWYSVALNGKESITINGSTARKIEKFIINDGEEDKDITPQTSFNNGVYVVNQTIDLDEEDGQTTYNVKVVFCDGDDETEDAKSIGTKTAKIDNKAPQAEVTVFTNSHQEGFLWLTKDVTDVFVKVPVDCDGEEGKVSGLDAVECTVNSVPRRLLKKDATIEDGCYVFKETFDTTGEEDFIIDILGLTDAAGNSAKLKKETKIKLSIDKKKPEISYTYNDIKQEEGQRMFFSGELNGTVMISDLDLDPESIKVEGRTLGEIGSEGKHTGSPSSDIKITMVKGVDDTNNNMWTLGNVKTAIYEFSTGREGEYFIHTEAKDLAKPEGNPSDLDSNVLVLDNTAPEIEISYDKDTPSEGGDSFYNSNVGVTVKITDKWLDKSKSVVKIKKVDQFGATTDLGPFNDFSGELGDEEHTFSFTTDGDGEYIVYVEAYDMSGNHSEKTGSKFTVDATVPEVTITFDKNDPMNEKYYNETRTATVTVTDFTFSEELAGLKVEEKYGTADIGGWTQSGAFTYTCTVTFEKDGQYELSCQSEDKAHNKSEEKSEPEFVIDKTAPQIQVNYNGAEAANGNFYKDTRIASVNIKEMSFDDKLVEITTQPLNEVGTLPATGGFSSADDQNIASITFDEDGTYGYVINCTDLAGNKAENYISDVFIIDKTVPEVTFSGVENKSANNAEVAPSVKYGDKYIDLEKSNVVLTGANNGVISVGNSITPTEDGFIVNYSDFAHDKSMDDMYTLKAYVYDKAGNAAEEELVFSVNRHGSVFVVDEGTRALNEMFYVKEPVDVKITEINIDDLTDKNVSVSRDNSDVISLKEGKNYTVSKQGDDESWKTFTYTIKRSNFERDGVYSISISTQDRASNKQDNKSRDADVTFAVDMTSPSVVAAGIEENGIYEETSHSFNVDVNDNMGVESLLVYVDGKVVGNYDQLAIDSGEDMSFTLDESEETRTITMIAEDFAGNKEVKVISGVLVSTKPINVKGVGGNTRIPGKTPKPVADTMRTILFIILAGASVASVAGASVLLYRRKVR